MAGVEITLEELLIIKTGIYAGKEKMAAQQEAISELVEALCLAHDHLCLNHENPDGSVTPQLQQIRDTIAKHGKGGISKFRGDTDEQKTTGTNRE